MSAKRARYDLYAARPGRGTNGQPLLITSNHFSVTYDHNKSIYSYYVSVINASNSNSNNVMNSARLEQNNRIVIKKLVEKNCRAGSLFYQTLVIYDGASCLYTSQKLPISETMNKFRITVTEENFNVSKL